MMVVRLRVVVDVVVNEASDNVIIVIARWRISNKLFMYRSRAGVDAAMRLPVVLTASVKLWME